MNSCEICGGRAELHHCIFKSQSKLLIKVPANFKYLCPEHHRGDISPHHNILIDQKYKREVQNILLNKFSMKFCFTEEEIKDILEISESETDKIIKHLKRYKEGYKGTEIVFHLLGDRWFK